MSKNLRNHLKCLAFSLILQLKQLVRYQLTHLHAVVGRLWNDSVGVFRSVSTMFEAIDVAIGFAIDCIIVFITDFVLLHKVFCGLRVTRCLLEPFLHVLLMQTFQCVKPSGVFVGKVRQIIDRVLVADQKWVAFCHFYAGFGTY